MRRSPCVILATLALVVTGVARSAVSETVSGTAFSISADGDLVTNAHVVSKCRQMRLRVHNGSATYEGQIYAVDSGLDLALIWLTTTKDQPAKTRPAPLRDTPALRVGEAAITYGFPLAGTLSVSGSVAAGYVSALRGLRDDPHRIQIATPVQQGNSGGPLLDGSGNVIGVIVSKLDAVYAMETTGDIPQNVNFAINVETLKQFLAAKKLATLDARSEKSLSVAEIAETARHFTYQIQCETDTPAPQPRARSPSSRGLGPFANLPREDQRGQSQVDLTSIKIVEVRQLYPLISPQTFRFILANTGTITLSEIILGARLETTTPCSKSPSDYFNIKRFQVYLRPTDSITLTGDLGEAARSFCVVGAR